MSARQSWLDSSDAPLISQYTEELTTFIDAMADGRIDEKELSDQEARLQKLMKEVEPKLDDALHGQVTKLLCELTAYNIMHTLSSLEAARPKTVFQG
jgi:hypothetical protein